MSLLFVAILVLSAVQTFGLVLPSSALASTSTSVSCNSSSLGIGSSTACTASVTGSSPSGNVTFSAGGVGLVSPSSATCTLSSGTCYATFTGEDAGLVNVSASYGGDLNNAPSVSQNITLSVRLVYSPGTYHWVGTVRINAQTRFQYFENGTAVYAVTFDWSWAGTLAFTVTCTAPFQYCLIDGNATGGGTGYVNYTVQQGPYVTICAGSSGLPQKLTVSGILFVNTTTIGDFTFTPGSLGLQVRGVVTFTYGVNMSCSSTGSIGGPNSYGLPFSGDFCGGALENGITETYTEGFAYAACESFAIPGRSGSITTTIAVGTDFLTASCHPQSQLVGEVGDCRAYVLGDHPTGTVAWGAYMAVTNATVGFHSARCILLPITSTLSTCLVWFRSYAYGTAKVSATYLGDANNPTMKGKTSVKVVQGQSDIALACSPSIVNGTLVAACTATVTGSTLLSVPTGTVVWNETDAIGIFSSSSVNGTMVRGVCELVDGRCGMSLYQGNTTVPATIVATYQGDSTHPSKQAAITLVAVEGGGAYADQNDTTGLTVKLSGVTGAIANVTTTNRFSQPSGTGTPPFATDEYFDVRVGGVTGGTATVCYLGAEVNATTSMDYYYNGAWIAATNINATAGVGICGTIPARALSGTPVAIGGSNTNVVTTTSQSATTAASSRTSTTSTTPSTTTTISVNTTTQPQTTTTTPGPGPIPEFPFQLLALPVLAALVVVSYLLVRRNNSHRKR